MKGRCRGGWLTIIVSTTVVVIEVTTVLVDVPALKVWVC